MKKITNEQFLRDMFGDQQEHAWVTGFQESPYKADRYKWAGGELRNGGRAKISDPELKNTFFTISTFSEDKEGRAKRRKGLYKQCHIILIDDVGTKVDEFDLEITHGIKPTYKLETSPDNYQWGFKITGDTPRFKVEALQTALIKMGFVDDKKDPGMKGVTRYGRLPVGVNNKEKYVEQLGQPFKHRVTFYDPNITYTLDDLAELFGIVLPTEPPSTNQQDYDKAAFAFDPTLEALINEGLYKESSATREDAYEITCPWVHEHTDGVDNGTHYFRRGSVDDDGNLHPEGGFNCFHGHCEHRNIGDLNSYLYAQGHMNVLGDAHVFEDLTAQTTHDLPLGIKTTGDLDVRRIPRRKWVVTNRLLRKAITATFAPGGTLKSTLTLTTGISLSLGRSVLGEEIRHPGNALVINNEDPIDELERRVLGIYTYYGIDPADTHNKFFYRTGNGSPFVFVDRKDDKMIAHPNVKTLIDFIKTHNIRYLAVDPFISSHSADENDNVLMNQVMDKYKRIADSCDIAIELVHHTRKQGADSEKHAGDVEAGRGASAVKDAARIVTTLAHMSRQTSDTLNMDWESEGIRMIRMDNAKANYSVQGAEPIWYRAESVTLGNDGMDPETGEYEPGDQVGVPVFFDMESHLEQLQQDQDVEQNNAIDQTLMNIVDVFNEAVAGAKPSTTAVKLTIIAPRLAALWGLSDKQSSRRVTSNLDFGYPKRRVVTSVEGHQFSVWLTQNAAAKTSPVFVNVLRTEGGWEDENVVSN